MWSFTRKIYTREHLAVVLSEAWKNPPRKLVFTNGCFDMLHLGHATYLEEARKLGNSLIVAINDDLSVRRLKGDKRPINPLEARCKLVAALESVDFVTWFEEDTPLETINLLKPEILVKGADYKVVDVVGAKEVVSWGGYVRVLPLVEGYSTTKILETLEEQ